MRQSEYTPNTGKSIFEYYMMKAMYLLGMMVSSGILYRVISDEDYIWCFISIPLIILTYLFDSIAMPIEKDNDGIVFHHLWRTSKLNNADIRFIRVHRRGHYSFERTDRIMYAIGKRQLTLYRVLLDDKNDLYTYYKEHGVIE